MKHRTREDGGAVVIALEGDVDLKTSPDARKALLDVVSRNRPVVVDLSLVNYIDSSGVASLIEAFQKAMQNMVASTIKVQWKKKSGGTADSTVTLVPISYKNHVFALHFVG